MSPRCDIGFDGARGRLRFAALVTTGLTLALGATASAAPRQPHYGEYGFRWMKHRCVQGPSGYVSQGSIRTEVRRLDQPSKLHYQEVTVQVDRLAGYGTASATWRKVDGRTYDWSRFKGRGLPHWAVSAERTQAQPDAATLSIRATVTLRRVRLGPDPKVWRYSVRSPQFRCFDL